MLSNRFVIREQERARCRPVACEPAYVPPLPWPETVDFDALVAPRLTATLRRLARRA